MFGCWGIYVSTYTTRNTSLPTPNAPVIVNYIGCAGWLCQHFYQYYRYTGDEALLRAEILPFKLETAAFYEDYVRRDETEKLCIVPSVSPENTPRRLHSGGLSGAHGSSQPGGAQRHDGLRDFEGAAGTPAGAERSLPPETGAGGKM